MAPLIQHPAPAFNNVMSVEAGQFKEVSLKDYLGRWYDLPFDHSVLASTETTLG